MKIYTALWVGIATACLAAGTLLCFALVAPGLWLVMATLTGVVAASAHQGVAELARHRRLRAPGRSELVAVAATTTIGVIGLGALMVTLALVIVFTLGVAALPLALHLASAPRAPQPNARASARTAGAPGAPLDIAFASTDRAVPTGDISAHLGPVVAAWPDEQLCRAWRSSYTRLDSSDLRTVEAVAWERQLYLDEIENRHPQAFRRWLDAHPRAASNPGRFLPTGRTSPPEPDRPPR